MIRLVLLLTLPALLAAQVIEGTVEDWATHGPVRKAQVILRSPKPGEKDRTVTTLDDGRFRFEKLAPGRYWISTTHAAYVHQADGAMPVDVTSSDQTLLLQLIPKATISGRITDEDGDPLAGCWVQACREICGVDTAVRTDSDETGAYRTVGINPGRYRLRARCASRPFQPIPLTAKDIRPEATAAYEDQFWPRAATMTEGQELDLTPGSERTGLDFQMKPIGAFTVRVAVEGLPPGDERARPSLAVLLIPRTAPTSEWERATLEGEHYAIRRVPVGSYLVAAYLRGPSPLGAVVPVDVTDKPVTVTVQLHPPFRVEGKLEVEGDVPLSQVQLSCFPRIALFGQGRTQQARPDAEGRFAFETTFPGEYQFSATSAAGRLYVKFVTVDGQVSEAGLAEFGADAGGELRIRVSTRLAAVSGSAPAGSTVVAEPVPASLWPYHAAQSAEVSPQGTYRLQIIPGKYRITLQTPATGIPFPDAKEVTLNEGDTVTVDLKSRP